MKKRIICQRCIHYFITWKPNQPHGCNAYGFKSKQVPAVVVKESSGMDCNFYQLKNGSADGEYDDSPTKKDSDYF
jgi:hypothetical protein